VHNESFTKVEQGWFALKPDVFLAKWYEAEYSQHSYSGAQAKLQHAMHNTLEKRLSNMEFHSILEVGANSGEHLEFVKHKYQRYVLSDLRDVSRALEPVLKKNPKAEFIRADVQSLPFVDGEFDRIIVTCVLHHLPDPEAALSELLRVAKVGGQIDIFLPSDPGIIFRFAKWIGPLRKAKKKGLSKVKRLVDARDHINHSFGLKQLIRNVFASHEIKHVSYPVHRMPLDLSLWNVYRIIKTS
jgi:phosphatidylethanolamine/phosphatidyl-N-methylethanolamine N-methyltransferase